MLLLETMLELLPLDKKLKNLKKKSEDLEIKSTDWEQNIMIYKFK